mmetsp:Transcript_4268/g.9226  ORF Transcript_4268/g.9226 Transcript_4268/m.9226 type:complete len:291 (-) Transcript_4268:158-1030(-)
MGGFFDLLKDDDVVVELLSSLDFRAAVRVGRTCKRMKKAADKTLDWWAAEALKGLPRSAEWADCDDPSNKEAALTLKWSDDFKSKVALVETALTGCNPGGQVSVSDYDEDHARHLLRSRGSVDVDDFLAADAQEDSDEVGWNVSIRFTEHMPFNEAVGKINKSIKALDGDDDDDDDEDSTVQYMGPRDLERILNPNARFDEEDSSSGDEEGIVQINHDPEEEEDVFRLQHFTLCLLRKADKNAIRYSRQKRELRHTDYPSGNTDEVILFKLPEHDNVEVQYKFSTSFQVV